MANNPTSAEWFKRGQPQDMAIDFTTPVLRVEVGSPTKTFYVNEKLICDSSEFFKTALKKEWSEGRQRTVDLTHDDANTFNIYVNWLHTHKVFVHLKAGQNAKDNSIWPVLVDSYSLADKLIDVDFKDAVTDAMVAATYVKHEDRRWLPNVSHRKNIYEKTVPGSKARALVVHMFASVNSSSLLDDSDAPEFLLDLSKALMPHTAGSVLVAAGKCMFHEHAVGSGNCYRNKYLRT